MVSRVIKVMKARAAFKALAVTMTAEMVMVAVMVKTAKMVAVKAMTLRFLSQSAYSIRYRT